MDHAWLDSLSEDWVSEPRSSGSPAPSLPRLPSSSGGTTDNHNGGVKSSRIPKFDGELQMWKAPQEKGISPLSERSPNDHNIPLSQRGPRQPSKLRDEASDGMRGRNLSRTVSASTSHSFQHSTVHHKSASLSPTKGSQQIPEWRRRLLQGEVAYGEQCDLFSPAGLENIFRPPNNEDAPSILDSGTDNLSIMRSSPPPYIRHDHSKQVVGDVSNENDGVGQRPSSQPQQQPQQRSMKYNLVDDYGGDLSDRSFEGSICFRRSKSLDATSRDHHSSVHVSLAPLVGQEGKAEDLRAVSGQTDIRNEEFSPVFVGKNQAVKAILDDSMQGSVPQEHQQILGLMEHPAAAESQLSEDTYEASIVRESVQPAIHGHFVNLRRGGYSRDGSFRRRPLSPSSLPAFDQSAMLPEESIQASTPKTHSNRKTDDLDQSLLTDSAQTSNQDLQTPLTSPSKSTERKNRGSPLKLFGNYDTFTNQKLLRRLSQFEDKYDERQDEEEQHSHQESLNPISNRTVNTSAKYQKAILESGQQKHRPRKATSFGQGDLDDYQFNEEVSYNLHEMNSDVGQEDDASSLPKPALGKKKTHHLDPAPIFEFNDSCAINFAGNNGQKRAGGERKVSQDLVSSIPSSPSEFENLQTPRKQRGDRESKRLLRSPPKDSTPKRRRTLQSTELAQLSKEKQRYSVAPNDAYHESHAVLSRKRKDAKHGEELQAANPNVLAMRQILRPRNPTPSQKGTFERVQNSHGAKDSEQSKSAMAIQAKKIAQIQAELDLSDSGLTATYPVANQQMQNDSRKGSVTTQDFLDEAKKIMAGIRGKARSGLASLEESEAENDRLMDTKFSSPEPEIEESYQESTREPFSRPPSRDGKPVERQSTQQQNPELLDHLRKYQEISDLDMAVASVKSLDLSSEDVASVKETHRPIVDDIDFRKTEQSVVHGDIIVVSDPPNIRISENPEMQRKRKHSGSSSFPGSMDNGDNEYPTSESNVSAGPSTSGSIPTGSSRGSDSRRNIAPHMVSHLIPEQLAGMFLDRERNIWIKRKPTDTHNIPIPSYDLSEDDPFGDIPDLSVDETQELRRLKVGPTKNEINEIEHQDKPHIEGLGQPASSLSHKFTNDRFDSIHEDHKTRIEKSQSTHALSSTTTAKPSDGRLSELLSDLQVSNSRSFSTKVSHTATYVSDVQEGSVRQVPYNEVVEKEISIHDDRVDSESQRKHRNVTISFSSPVAQIMSSPRFEDSSVDNPRQGIRPAGKDIPLDAENILINQKKNTNRSAPPKIRSALRTTSRRMSIGSNNFLGRPVSRIDEDDEEALSKSASRDRCNSLTFVASTPLPVRRDTSVVVATPLAVEIGNLSLTPLSDFTMHQADRSFGMDVSYVEGGQRYALGINSKRTLSLSIKDLVEKLTQVEPYEPYWEYLKHVDLKNKSLTTLHKLDEFCEHLVELDASRNQISQLDGVPSNVRDLRITHNRLSDLAAWGHLLNLQYVDVSNNEIESLSGFRNLVHLRGLRADNNKIQSLDGIFHLNGLLQLRVRGNLIEKLDFANCGLQRLTDLDVKDNHISHIHNIHELPVLSSLNVEENCLSELVSKNTLRALRYLKLSGNQLERLDVSRFPDLRLLYLDRNRLESIHGLSKTKYLDSLSMREQQEGVYIDTAFLSQALEVRKLFLSGNLLATFQPQVEYLNLQYLELANCGIETLSPEFGYMIPNARVLNLNFNALKDIRPLNGIVRLKKLHLAGNRLSKLRTTTSVISQIKTLASVDLRNNPLTQGFYPAISETRLIIQDDIVEDAVAQPFILRDADRSEDTKYVSRLDQATKMRRRTLEMLVFNGCRRLKTLDGLFVDRSVLNSKDVVWKAMVASGLLKMDEVDAVKDVADEVANAEMKENGDMDNDSGETLDQHSRKGVMPQVKSFQGKSTDDNTRMTERWHAEDSFA